VGRGLASRRRVPRRIADDLACVSIYSYGSHEYEVEWIEGGEEAEHAYGDKFRFDTVSDPERTQETQNTDDEEPFRNRESEEDELGKGDWALWEIDKHERKDKASILRNEIVREFSDKEKGEKSETRCEVARAFSGLGEGERGMFEGSLNPALRPSQSLLPKGRESSWRKLIRDDIKIVHDLGAARDRSQSRVNVFCQHVSVHLHLAQ